jgi:hypothetical protein
LSATDAAAMMISEDSSFTGATYETYVTSKSFTLSSGDDTKTVYVKYKDVAGNETASISDSIALATHAPTGGTVSINSGSAMTNNTNVTLSLYADNATEVMMSEDSGFGGASYVSYATTKSFTLSSGEGTKTVYVKYKDIAGNQTTTTISDTIILDTTPPSTGPVTINGGAAYTNSQTVSLTIPTIADADQMMISESSSFAGASYQTYAGTVSYSLSAGDGTKSLYIKYKDTAGNASAASSAATIILDTQAPTSGSISINAGDAYTNNSNVTLAMSATGATNMMLSEDSSFTGATYEAYATSKSFTLSSGDDTKTVYVKYKDAAGNETTSISDSIILATHAPTGGTVSVNGGASATNSTGVTLSLYADNATQMMISEDSGFVGASYVSYATTKSFTLSSGEGTKTVYVKYKDIAGNATTTTISDSITLDTTPPNTAPVDINSGAAYTNNQTVSLAIPAIADAAQMMISESGSFTGASYQVYVGTTSYNLSTGDGTKSLYIKYKDVAGNESAASLATTIILDTQAPTLNSINIDLGAAYTTQTNVLLTLASTGADYMMVSEDSSFSTASYESYATTKNLTLSSTNGTKTIYVKYKDLAGNVSSAVNDVILLDTEGPADGSVVINSGDTYTNSNAVTLTLSATDAVQMMISQDSSFSGATYEAYATSKTFSLSSTDGSKTVYVKYKDNHGNESAVISDSIYVDSNFHGVILTPGTVSVQKGNTQTFSAVVALVYGYTQDVTWSVSGNSSAETYISSTGVLNVGIGESATTLLVKATSTSSATVYGTATVTVTEIPVVTYAISTSVNPLVGGSVSGAGTITSGSSATLTATANSGYIFKNWTENGTIVSTNAIYTISNITANHTYVANFKSETTLGDITKKVETAKNVPEMSVDMDSDNLINAVFTEEEKLQIQNGVDAEILFQVDNIDSSVTKSDKKLIEAAAEGYEAGQYLDISVWKQFGSAAKTRLTSLNAPVKFKIKIPKTLLNYNPDKSRSFAVVRVHNDKTTVLQDLDSDSKTLTISTPLFSTYAIVYKDTAKVTSDASDSTQSTTTTTSTNDLDSVPDTGENSPIVWLFVLVGISGMGIFAFGRKKSKEV